MFAKLKRLFEIPDNHFTAKEIFRWLWRVLQGNRLQAVLNATIGLLGVFCSNDSCALGVSLLWASHVYG